MLITLIKFDIPCKVFVITSLVLIVVFAFNIAISIGSYSNGKGFIPYPTKEESQKAYVECTLGGKHPVIRTAINSKDFVEIKCE